MRSLRELVDWYFSKRTFPYWCILLLDATILLFTSIFVYWCFYHGAALQQNFWPLMRFLALGIAIHMIFFAVFRTYAGIIRYSSFTDLVHIAYAMACSAAAVIIIHYGTNALPNHIFAQVRTQGILVAEAVSTALLWSLRIIIRRVYDVYFRTNGAIRVFIYGIREGGISLAKSIRSDKPMRYELCGFIAHDPALNNGSRLMGMPVYDSDEHLPEILSKKKIRAVLVAPGRIERLREDVRLQNYILSAGAQILVTNDVVDASHPDLVGTLREVSVEELLPRDEITVDMNAIREELRGKRVLITGSAGSIGSEIVRQVAAANPASMMLIDAAETPQHDIRLMMARDYPSIPCETVVTSITNEGRMNRIFKDFRPQYVFHAAAYKHVPMMEDNPCESIENNVNGTKILADASVKYGVDRFVMVSTDKAVNPTNVMGCSKRICEIYVQSLDKAEQAGEVDGHTEFITTRFGNVLGSNGSVIPLFREQIKHGGPVTVTDPNIIRFFMLIPEACNLVLEAGTKGGGGEIFVFDMGKPVRIADLARRMIELSGAKNVEIKYTGLRDGEKLYEEVLNELESTKPSFHQKIRIASTREYDWQIVSAAVADLVTLARSFDDMATVKAMKKLVPEFRSNHSKYEILDKEPRAVVELVETT